MTVSWRVVFVLVVYFVLANVWGIVDFLKDHPELLE
jgi:hypothetical protein